MPLSVHLVINLHLCACPILHVGGTRQIKGGIPSREESLYTMEWPFTELDGLICNLSTPSTSQKSLFRGARCCLPNYWNDLSFLETSNYNYSQNHRLIKPKKSSLSLNRSFSILQLSLVSRVVLRVNKNVDVSLLNTCTFVLKCVYGTLEFCSIFSKKSGRCLYWRNLTLIKIQEFAKQNHLICK